MKSISIFGPTIVNGLVRHPYEGDLIVSNKEAARLVTAGVLADEPKDADGDEPVEDEAPADDPAGDA